MKSFLMFALVMLVRTKLEFTVAQWNVLYHFDNLEKSFEYSDPEIFPFETRLANNIQVFNEINADINGFVEWNGNILNPFYVDSEEKLKALTVDYLKKPENLANLKILLEKGKWKSLWSEENAKARPFETLFSHLAEIRALTPQAKIDAKTKLDAALLAERDIGKHEKLKKKPDAFVQFLDFLIGRLYTTNKIKEINFYKDTETYAEVEMVNKRTGQYIGADLANPDFEWNPTKYKSEINPEQDTPMQALKVFYNKKKFQVAKHKVNGKNVDDVRHYTLGITKNGKVELIPQNFLCVRLDYVGHEEGKVLFLILVHMKSKRDGFLTRIDLGRVIDKYVKKLKHENPTADVMLMGDLNSEIHEVAFDLDAKIIRLQGKSDGTDFVWKHEKEYSKADEEKDIDDRIKEIDDTIVDFDDKVSPLKYTGADQKLKDAEAADIKNFKDALNAGKTKLNALKTYCKAAQNDNGVSETWIEATRFSTEKKIRIGEIMFESDAEYAGKLSTKYAEVEASLEKPKAVVPNYDGKSISQKYQEKVKTDQLNGKNKFLSVVKHLRVHDKTHVDQFVSEFLFEEKIDFVLLNFNNDFQIKSVSPISHYTGHLQKGIPNETFSSDHFPSKFTMEVDFEKKFNLSTFLAVQRLRSLSSKNVIQQTRFSPKVREFIKI